MNKNQMAHLERLMSESEMRDMDIFGVGNPLVDIVVEVDDEFLKSYNLPKNGSILADIQHEELYDDIMNKYDIDYSAGGSVQNALRYCQWVVGKNNSVANFIGAVGDDYFGRVLATKVKADGLNVKYMITDRLSTGVSAIMFTDGVVNKSICTNLGACRNLDKNFLMSNFWFCERARVIFTSGHLIPVNQEVVIYLAKHAHEWGKEFFFKLGAAYVVHKYSNIILEVLPFIDFLFCSDDEAIAFATMKGYHSKEIKTVAKLLAEEPKVNYDNPRIPNHYKSGRIVVITQKNKPVLLAISNIARQTEVKEFPVTVIKEDLIKDTSGAGDALIGGFLAMYIDGRDLDACVRCGLYCANECVQLPGCVLPKQMNWI